MSASLTRRTLQPGTGRPEEPYLISPGAFDRKMCSNSVEPTPSRISTPNRLFHRLPTDSGRASPADVHIRSRAKRGSLLWLSSLSMAANSVGTPKKMLGSYLRISANILAGVGRSEFRTVVAPTDIGKVSALPRP